MKLSPLTILVAAAVALTGLGVLARPAASDSLYRRSTRSLYSDRRARQVGDLVTLVVLESTTATQQAKSGRSAKSTAKTALDLRKIPGFPQMARFFPFDGFSNSESSSGEGTTSRSAKLTSTITCRVVDVTPQGNLVIEGLRSVKVNRDTQILRISGTVRYDDISQRNIVLSSAIADLKIELIGKGPINVQQKPGIFTRIFRFLF